jgi:D-glycero-alpha-D-manno-heptose-7-phosphate kinase
MIIVRSPLRITLGGGGTDLPSYYRGHGGFLVAAAIDKYVYITLHKTFQPGYILKYSELERAAHASDIKHPILRAAIEFLGADDRVEIASMADIPAGTGLGSSGSFTTALLRALHARQRNVITPHALADQACYIEIDLLREPVAASPSTPRLSAPRFSTIWRTGSAYFLPDIPVRPRLSCRIRTPDPKRRMRR